MWLRVRFATNDPHPSLCLSKSNKWCYYYSLTFIRKIKKMIVFLGLMRVLWEEFSTRIHCYKSHVSRIKQEYYGSCLAWVSNGVMEASHPPPQENRKKHCFLEVWDKKIWQLKPRLAKWNSPKRVLKLRLFVGCNGEICSDGRDCSALQWL